MTEAICPSCGFNLSADTPLTLGDWHLDPRGTVSFKGKRLLLRPSWVHILTSLARAGGRSLSAEVLLSRTSDSEIVNTLSSQISQMRKVFRASSVPDPIETTWHHGYRWRVAA